MRERAIDSDRKRQNEADDSSCCDLLEQKHKNRQGQCGANYDEQTDKNQKCHHSLLISSETCFSLHFFGKLFHFLLRSLFREPIIKGNRAATSDHGDVLFHKPAKPWIAQAKIVGVVCLRTLQNDHFPGIGIRGAAASIK